MEIEKLDRVIELTKKHFPDVSYSAIWIVGRFFTYGFYFVTLDFVGVLPLRNTNTLDARGKVWSNGLLSDTPTGVVPTTSYPHF
jgi:hypothetical protein